jgi:4-hydroxy-2-oxoheptanedioate aldolase
MNILKEKIKKKMRICGTHVHLSDPSICEIMGNVGFDYIWIDMEHTYIDYKTLFVHLNAAKAAGVPAVVRVPQDDLTATKKVLEMGVDGIIFPMIKNAEQANRLIGYTLYPPVGTRGFGPMRAIRYGLDDVNEYIHHSSLDICRFIQIENIEAVDHLPEIIQNTYIDGYIFGPYDLSGSVGELGNITGEKTINLIKKSIEILEPTGKAIGLSTGDTDIRMLKFWNDMGIHMISAGIDYGYILSGSMETLRKLREVQKTKGEGN